MSIIQDGVARTVRSTPMVSSDPTVAWRILIASRNVLPTLACQQPVMIDARHHHQLQKNLNRHPHSGFVTQPGLRRNLERIGQDLAAIFAAYIVRPRGGRL